MKYSDNIKLENLEWMIDNEEFWESIFQKGITHGIPTEFVMKHLDKIKITTLIAHLRHESNGIFLDRSILNKILEYYGDFGDNYNHIQSLFKMDKELFDSLNKLHGSDQTQIEITRERVICEIDKYDVEDVQEFLENGMIDIYECINLISGGSNKISHDSEIREFIKNKVREDILNVLLGFIKRPYNPREKHDWVCNSTGFTISQIFKEDESVLEITDEVYEEVFKALNENMKQNEFLLKPRFRIIRKILAHKKGSLKALQVMNKLED